MSEKPSLFDHLRARLSVAGLKRTPLRYYVAILFFGGLAVAPSTGQMEVLNMLQWTDAFFFVMFVISWDFVVGYTGQVSFGHTLFFAAGGYTTAILNLQYGVDPVVGIVLGTLMAGAAGVLYAIPALRLEGHYLALFTLLPPLILLRLFRLFRDTTGGSRGLPNPDPLIDAGSFTANAQASYYLALVLLILIFALAWIITRSDTGKIFTAIKESEDAVESAGLNPAKYKVFAMVLSALIGGLAGAVFVHTPVGSASPSQLLELVVIIEVLIASIVGGFGTITGGVLGGFLIYWGRDWFRNAEQSIPGLDIAISDVNLLLFFGVLLLLLYFLAEGILPWWYRQFDRLLTRVRGDEPSAVTDGGRTWLERQMDGLTSRGSTDTEENAERAEYGEER